MVVELPKHERFSSSDIFYAVNRMTDKNTLIVNYLYIAYGNSNKKVYYVHQCM